MKYTFLILFFLFCKNTFAQQAVHIAGSDTVNIAGDAAIFDTLLLQGTLLTQKNTIYFLGNYWENSPNSSLAGNGTFHFSGNKRQWISSGYHHNENKGPAFPNIVIDNPQGIYLADLNDLHISHRLHFLNGSLYLNGWNLVVDDSITGYTDKQFVITGNGIGGGSLYRKASYSGKHVFPIGTDAMSYTPLAVAISNPIAKEIGARVFDHVYEQVTTGKMLDSNRVMKTWQLSALPTHEDVPVWLQHNASDEGFIFSKNRDSSYISVYDATTARWDEDSLPGGVITPGDLTTGTRIPNTYMTYRTLPSRHNADDAVQWLSIGTKGASSGCPLLQFNLWKSVRYNYKWVQLFWRTQYEINISRYEVQVRRDTASDYSTLVTVESQSHAQPGNRLLYYYYAHENEYNGISYYRLKIIAPNGCITYADEKEVNPGFGISVWPNPASDHIDIRILVIQHPLAIQLVNTLGKIRREATITGEGRVNVKTLPDGAYFLIVRDPEKGYQILSTIKIAIQHKN